MNQHQVETNYSVKWASDIVQAFNGKYVRATEAVKKIYQFSDENVAMWVASAPRRWQNYKKIVKQLDRWDKHQNMCRGEGIDMDKSVADAVIRVLRIA